MKIHILRPARIIIRSAVVLAASYGRTRYSIIFSLSFSLIDKSYEIGKNKIDGTDMETMNIDGKNDETQENVNKCKICHKNFNDKYHL